MFYSTDANISYLEENELTFSKPASPAEDLEFDALLAMAKRQQSVDWHICVSIYVIFLYVYDVAFFNS